MPMKKNSAAAIKQLHRVEKKRQAIITKLLHIHNEHVLYECSTCLVNVLRGLVGPVLRL